eukprot:363015-Chlamydomonas_euryale.AAC.5
MDNPAQGQQYPVEAGPDCNIVDVPMPFVCEFEVPARNVYRLCGGAYQTSAITVAQQTSTAKVGMRPASLVGCWAGHTDLPEGMSCL